MYRDAKGHFISKREHARRVLCGQKANSQYRVCGRFSKNTNARDFFYWGVLTALVVGMVLIFFKYWR